MSSTIALPHPPVLYIVRVPGEPGTIVRCSGELTVATGEALWRELELLASLCLPALILNLSGCSAIDLDAISLLLEGYQRAWVGGCPIMIATGTTATGHILRGLGLDRIIPLFPTEAAATLALQDRSFLEIPASQPEIAAEVLERWRQLLASQTAQELLTHCVSTMPEEMPTCTSG